MINSSEFLKEIHKNNDSNIFVLGTVTENNKIKIDGNSNESKKIYKKLNNIVLEEFDRVLLLKISGTFIILGKIT